MKVKEESEKVGLKLNIQKTKIMASGPITSWQIDEETVETVADFIFLGSKICRWWSQHEIKRHLLLGRKVMMNLDSTLKSRDMHCYKHIRLDSKHGTDHECSSPERQLNDGLHGSQEAPGDQPWPLPSLRPWGKRQRLTRISLWRIWSSCCTKQLSYLVASVWRIPRHTPTGSTGWSNLVSVLTRMTVLQSLRKCLPWKEMMTRPAWKT